MAEIDLVATSGPLEGTRFRLRRDEPLLLGRSSRGVHLADPKVSVQHAQIEFVGGRFLLTDLGSATGTRIAGAPIEAGKPVPIEIGFTVQVGDSDFRVSRAGRGGWLRTAALALLLLLSLVVLGGVLWLGFVAEEEGTRLSYASGIRTSSGPPVTEVVIPPDFLRRHGLAAHQLTVDRVGDDDGNGLDEVWLGTARAQFVVTFDEMGTWIQLGELPLGCERAKTIYDEARQVAPELPTVRCGGETWVVSGGRYELVGHDAPVVWVDPRTAAKPPEPASKGKKPKAKADKAAPAPAAKAGPAPAAAPAIQVVRTRMVHPERIAAFLKSRGVTGPVHYLVCEGALEGLAAQVRLASGELRRISPGCLDEILFDGQKLGEVRMVAFSAVGRRALLDDLASTWGGSPEGLWLDAARAAQLDALSEEPGLPRGATLLTAFRVDDAVPWEAAPEIPLGDRVRLIPSIAPATPADPPAVVRTLTESGDQVIDPPGCAKYLLSVSPFTCRVSGGCLTGQTFLRLIEVGCGQPVTVLEVPYEAGVRDIETPTRLRTRIAVRDLPDGVEVTRADVGWIPVADPP